MGSPLAPLHPRQTRRRATLALGATALAVGAAAALGAAPSSAQTPDTSSRTASPIKHLVVIFDENVSFDHYFGTYPNAANTDGTTFRAITSTPRANTLQSSGLLVSNPNAANPTRLTPAQAVTCDQDHNYSAEQKAVNGGAMDQFVENTSVDACAAPLYGRPGLVMDYYDGNTVTGLWNYAQQYAMSDNSFGTTFGPSTPGALNLVAAQTHGFRAVTPDGSPTTDSYAIAHPDANGVGTVINDPDPAFDDCANKNRTTGYNLAAATGGDQNVGDLLGAKGVTWGWFQGGFRPTVPASSTTPYAVCGATHANVAGVPSLDYSPHHNPFAYYASTANPHHLPPTSLSMVGHNDQANHQYDLTDFDKVARRGTLPAVSFLKAPEYQDGHAAYSDPLDEQHFLVNEINTLQKSPEWKSTAVVIAYDDSDGWYDHVASPVLNGSQDAATDTPWCSAAPAPALGGYQDRCGPGPRLPLLVVSPWAKTNYVSHAPTEQASVTKFIEDNWFLPRLGDAAFDARAGRMNGMFDFTRSNGKEVLLAQNGSVRSVTPIR